MLKVGKKSTEWWGVVSVGVFALLKSAGIVDQDVSMEQITSPEAIPALVELVRGAADKYGNVGLYGLLMWAYVKRRSHLKSREISREDKREV